MTHVVRDESQIARLLRQVITPAAHPRTKQRRIDRAFKCGEGYLAGSKGVPGDQGRLRLSHDAHARGDGGSSVHGPELTLSAA
jgi:hypothetical protein